MASPDQLAIVRAAFNEVTTKHNQTQKPYRELLHPDYRPAIEQIVKNNPGLLASQYGGSEKAYLDDLALEWLAREYAFRLIARANNLIPYRRGDPYTQLEGRRLITMSDEEATTYVFTPGAETASVSPFHQPGYGMTRVPLEQREDLNGRNNNIPHVILNVTPEPEVLPSPNNPRSPRQPGNIVTFTRYSPLLGGKGTVHFIENTAPVLNVFTSNTPINPQQAPGTVQLKADPRQTKLIDDVRQVTGLLHSDSLKPKP